MTILLPQYTNNKFTVVNEFQIHHNVEKTTKIAAKKISGKKPEISVNDAPETAADRNDMPDMVVANTPPAVATAAKSPAKLWEYTFFTKMGLKRENMHNYQVLVTEAARNPKGNREKMGEILFEKMGFGGVLFEM